MEQLPILLLIILVAISQLGIYFILDQTNKKHGKTILFILVLMAHFFVFPPYYYPQPVPGGTNCGMPLLGIMLVFWLIGGGITVIIHVGYHLSKFVQKSRLNNKPAPENPQTH